MKSVFVIIAIIAIISLSLLSYVLLYPKTMFLSSNSIDSILGGKWKLTNDGEIKSIQGSILTYFQKIVKIRS
uniref:Uncharacterized protein n=1 Tax=Acidianus brierleyi TaxID=41673 RepID=A0A2U9IFP6_9CREN